MKKYLNTLLLTLIGLAMLAAIPVRAMENKQSSKQADSSQASFDALYQVIIDYSKNEKNYRAATDAANKIFEGKSNDEIKKLLTQKRKFSKKTLEREARSEGARNFANFLKEKLEAVSIAPQSQPQPSGSDHLANTSQTAIKQTVQSQRVLEAQARLKHHNINSFADALGNGDEQIILDFLKTEFYSHYRRDFSDDNPDDIVRAAFLILQKEQNLEIIQWTYAYSHKHFPPLAECRSYLESFLIDFWISLEEQDISQETQQKLIKAVSRLLVCMKDNGESVNHQDEEGYSALHNLASLDSQDVAIKLAKLILEASPDQQEFLNFKNHLGYTALELAQKKGNRSTFGQFLADNAANLSKPETTADKQEEEIKPLDNKTTEDKQEGPANNQQDTNPQIKTSSFWWSAYLQPRYILGTLGVCVVAAIAAYYFWQGHNSIPEEEAVTELTKETS